MGFGVGSSAGQLLDSCLKAGVKDHVTKTIFLRFSTQSAVGFLEQ